MKHAFIEQLEAQGLNLPYIKSGNKVTGVIMKHADMGVLVNCVHDSFTGIILPKEVKELERNNFDVTVGQEVEAEILGSDIITEEGYFVISITKLKQQDAMKVILKQMENDEVITVVPTEANLWGLIVDMYGVKWFIPLSQLAPINYPRVEDGDQEKIFWELLNLLGKEFKVRIMNFDDGGRRMVLSEKEAMREERAQIVSELKVWNVYDGTVSGISSYWFFVTIGWGIEWLVHLSEITYGHVTHVDSMIRVGNPMKVQVIGYEDGKISLSAKTLKEDPWKVLPEKYQLGDVIEWEVVRYVPYGVFIRVFEDINGLVHLSEINSQDDKIQLTLGQVVKAKIILFEPNNRKIWLSIRAVNPDGSENTDYQPKKTRKPRPRKVESAVKTDASSTASENSVAVEANVSKAWTTDDLKLINKIWPALEKRLNALGIMTYADIVALTDEAIATLEEKDAMTSLDQRHAWIDEAKSLMNA
jgi:small subunit ribosomal protein S1